MNFSDAMAALKKDMSELAAGTGGFGWDRGPDVLFSDPKNLGAKPIPKNEWVRAFVVASMLVAANPKQGVPVPGADPDGFVWLTWERGAERFALALKRGGYAWDRRHALGTNSHTSARLQDVSEALRATISEAA